MGTSMAPMYTNLFMGNLNNTPCSSLSLIWWRFIDDGLHFTSYLNSIHPIIKFTHVYSNSSHQTLPFPTGPSPLKQQHIQTDSYKQPIASITTFSKLHATQTIPNKLSQNKPLPPNPSHMLYLRLL